jgi:hypothetical protein
VFAFHDSGHSATHVEGERGSVNARYPITRQPQEKSQRTTLSRVVGVIPKHGRVLRQVIDLGDADAGPAIISGDDCGVLAGRQGSDQGRFKIILWRHAGGCDFGGLSRVIPPVVIENERLFAGSETERKVDAKGYEPRWVREFCVR